MEEALEGVKNATNEQDLANRFKEFGKEMVKLNYVAARRQQVTGSNLSPPLSCSVKVNHTDLYFTFRHGEISWETTPSLWLPLSLEISSLHFWVVSAEQTRAEQLKIGDVIMLESKLLHDDTIGSHPNQVLTNILGSKCFENKL